MRFAGLVNCFVGRDVDFNPLDYVVFDILKIFGLQFNTRSYSFRNSLTMLRHSFKVKFECFAHHRCHFHERIADGHTTEYIRSMTGEIAAFAF